MPEPKKRGLKRLLLAFVLLYAAFALIPAAVYGTSRLDPGDTAEPSPAPESATQSASSAAPTPSPEKTPEADGTTPSSAVPGFLDELPLSQTGDGKEEEVFTLYDTAAEEILTVPVQEFLPAALACEMDLSAPREALKAQAVAIYTLYSRQRDSGESVHGADFACDTENWLVYVPQEAMKERWGEDFADNYTLLQEITNEVSGQLLTERGKPILASYFAISSGSTELAENVWAEDAGVDFPYLQAVASPGDRLSDGYLSAAAFTEDEFREAVASYFTEEPPDLSGPPEAWLKAVETTPSGYVKNAELGGKTVTGGDLRSALSLRSAAFEHVYQDGTFTFTVRGWGHGVGMSQAGAVFLAKRGADYREILSHYYPGTTLTSPA